MHRSRQPSGGTRNGSAHPAHTRPASRGPARRAPGGPSSKALVIRGCTGRYSIINGAYEPNGVHGTFPCWVSRASPCCVFHTGKSRWVIGKEFDDGGKCYAFIQDDASENPAQCKGLWTVCNERGEWGEDSAIQCHEAAVSQDPFVRLRGGVEAELQKVHISTEGDRASMWRRIDRNGDGCADLAEVEVLVADLCKSGTWPNFLNNQTALERAYKKTLDDNPDGDDVVPQTMWHELLLNVFWFGKLHDVFTQIDTGDDESLDLGEFRAGMDKLGIQLSSGDIEAEFRQIDQDRSGLVDFAEFCVYVRKRMEPNPDDGALEADTHRIVMHDQMRLSCGHAATAGTVVKKKNFEDFDKLEKRIKDICNEPDNKGLKRLWRGLDFNGNNVVSLAEIDKWVVEKYPLLNHKPALIRAQKATLAEGNGNDWVEKKEFKFLLTNLFYFNKLFWLFDQSDEGRDRRMDMKEFQFCLSMVGIKVSPSKAKSEFDKIDQNKGGQILFDEFCSYIVEKRCPEGMTQFIADE